MPENGRLSLWRRFAEICIPYLAIERRDGNENRSRTQDKTVLRRALPGWQIFMIAISGVIGVTIFSTQGEILRLAGPGGLLVATVFVAITTICVLETIGELVILWPVTNSMVEYVRAFVDEDLAIVVGIAYWYAMSCIFSTLIAVAANLAVWPIPSGAGRGILFYGVVPICLVLINALGVEYFGFVEGVGGIIKILMVITGEIYMIFESTQEAGTKNLDDGFQNQQGVATSRLEAICIAIPLISYGYICTEIVSVTSFEAIERKSLRFPVRAIAYIVALSYILSALLQSFLVNYQDQNLQSVVPENTTDADKPSSPYSVIVIVALNAGSASLAKYFNGCIIYFCISAANTALYAASRTLFGLTRYLDEDESISFPFTLLRHFGTITPVRKVPLFALVFSAIAFYWVIPLGGQKGFGITNTLVILTTTASIGVIIVWASQCVAYMRYYCWLRRFRDLNSDDCVMLDPKYNRWDPQPDRYEWHAHRMLLADLKLIPAIVGLINCFAIVFVLSSANWWIGDVTAKKLATAYAGPIILTLVFIFLKIKNRRRWVVLNDDTEQLAEVLGNLERSSNLRDIPQDHTEAVELRGEEEQTEGMTTYQAPADK